MVESLNNTAPVPSKTFTNTILQYKEQISNMRSYLKDLEKKEDVEVL